LSSFLLTVKQQWTIKISSPLFSILSLAAILVGSRDQRTQNWKGAIQESFQQSLAEICSVVFEEKIFFKFHPPLFSNLHNRSKSAKFKVHKKSSNIYKKAHYYAYTVQIWAHSGLK
jgi:hypothetical protein